MAFTFSHFHPSIHQLQQQDVADLNGQAGLDAGAQLFMIENWINGLAAELGDLHHQLRFTQSNLIPHSVEWLVWNKYIAEQLEVLYAGIAIHHSWLSYLQQMSPEISQQGKLEEPVNVDSPQYRYTLRLRELNESLEGAYVEGMKKGAKNHA